MVYGRQAVDLRQALARENPNKFNEDLALTLAIIAECSQRLRQHGAVVKFGREAAALLRSLPPNQPEWFRSQCWLVHNLEVLGPSLFTLGLINEAVQVHQEGNRLKQSLGSVSGR